MAIASMAQKNAQSENQDLQNLQNNMHNAIQIPQQQQFQLPSINSVFGSY